jgi:hypothetical protein
MPTELKLWQIENERPNFVPRQTLNLESRIEDWIRHDITLISDDLLVIGQQLETAYGGFIDLLAIDPVGNLVILELKRDKTPRDIVAQCLDYASWVQALSHESIQEIASGFLKDRTLDQAFQEKFHTDLPDVLNERHRIYIVASALDASTERIVKYLSETHDVDINVATFAYFKTASHEFLGRSLLLDEAAVQTRAESKSKRTPPRSWEELQRFAEENGVASLYERALLSLRPLFDGANRTRSNVAFIGNMGDNNAKNVIIGIYPGLSNTSDGLAVMLFIDRLYEYFGIAPDDLRPLLSHKANDVPTYDPNATWFFDDTRLANLVEILRRAKANGEQTDSPEAATASSQVVTQLARPR